jgi:hypothetical protein
MQFFPGSGGVHLSARGRGRKRPTWVTEQNLSKNKKKRNKKQKLGTFPPTNS